MHKSNLKVVNAKNNVQFDIWQCKTWALTCIMHFYRFTYLSCIFTEIGWSKKFIISKIFLSSLCFVKSSYYAYFSSIKSSFIINAVQINANLDKSLQNRKKLERMTSYHSIEYSPLSI